MWNRIPPYTFFIPCQEDRWRRKALYVHEEILTFFKKVLRENKKSGEVFGSKKRI